MSFNYLTPEEAFALHKGLPGHEDHGLTYWRELAKDARMCELCGAPVWKIANTGLCFSCTTGEADPSNDYELTTDFQYHCPKCHTALEEARGEYYCPACLKDKIKNDMVQKA